MPLEHPARHVVGVVASLDECVCCHRRTPTAAAIEDHRQVALDRLCLSRQVRQLDQSRPGDVPGVVLMLLAHVDQLDVTIGDQFSNLFGRVIHQKDCSRSF